MKTYDYAEIGQKFASIFETAINEDVILNRNDGHRFIIISYDKYKSPFDSIKGLKKSITNDQIVDIVKETRARS